MKLTLNYINFITVCLWCLCSVVEIRGQSIPSNDVDIQELSAPSMTHIEAECIKKCPDQNRTNTSNQDADCGTDCNIKQCSTGCSLWEGALDSSCEAACNASNKDMIISNGLYCVMGCNDAIIRYINWLRAEVGTPSAPALVADTLTATSLALVWELPPRFVQYTSHRLSRTPNYMVQWRYEEKVADWTFCGNHSIGANSTVHIVDLQPYTKYRFRVALVLLKNSNEMIYSEQSVIISTLAQGVPASPPVIVRAVAVDHTRISVSWEPGPRPNGPILSYVLQIEDLKTHIIALKDIPASDNTSFYNYDNLQPNTSHAITLRMRNEVGEGPTTEAIVTTLPQPEKSNKTEEFSFILASEHSIISQGREILSASAKVIYKSKALIKGVALHIKKKLMFVSNADKFIFQTSLDGPGHVTLIMSPDNENNFAPLDLSMDWLNDYLYILGEVSHSSQKFWQISRCRLNGTGHTIVFAGLTTKPSHIEVDPFNGYFFWVIVGNTSESGVYRIDLGDVSNGVRHEVKPPFLIFKRGLIGAITIDYARFRLLASVEDANTVYSLSLDGKTIENLREKTQSASFKNVTSIVTSNGLFYWTSGKLVLMEENHDNTYFTTAFSIAENQTFFKLGLNITSFQPTPIPVNPPTNVQSLFSSNKAKVSWQDPHLLGHQGKGTWQGWSYDLEIFNGHNNITTIERGIKGNHYVVNKLISNNVYKFRVAARTDAGMGPYSTPFQAKTLQESKEQRSIIWASEEGLLQSDIIGDHIRILIPKSEMGDYDISDITWFGDIVYYVSNKTLKYYNLKTALKAQLDEIDSVQSVSVDWIGHKLYWFNPTNQMIIRANFFGHEQEPLGPTTARTTELKIDAIGGSIYYSTGHTLESCRLNGKHKREYYRLELYSGKQVMGLTLDIEKRLVYWIVRGYNGSTLFRASMSNTDAVPLFHLDESFELGALTHFSDRLLWLRNNHTLIVGDMTGHNLARIHNSKLRGLKAFTVIDPTYYTNGSHNSYKVTPEQVNASSLSVVGVPASFNITWDPIRDVTYGDVFYELRIGNEIVKETTNTYFHYPHTGLKPYTPLNVTIQAYTYWATSKKVYANLHTPAAPPSSPTNPRIFITHSHDLTHNKTNVEAQFRWNPPVHPNGPIEGYKVDCWYDDNGDRITICDGVRKSSDMMEHSVPNLILNLNYIFQVQAFTDVGMGKSSWVQKNSSIECPPPRILAATNDSVISLDLDVQSKTLVHNAGQPVLHLAHIAMSKRLFWTNDNNEIISYNGTKVKLYSANSQVLCLTVDWVERYLYWFQINGNGSDLYSLDLNKFDLMRCEPEVILKNYGLYVTNLVALPQKRTLYWIQRDHLSTIHGKLFAFNLDDRSVNIPNTDNCGLTANSIHTVLALDTSSAVGSELIIVDPYAGIKSYDLNQNCTHIESHFYKQMTSLVKDSARIYWYLNGTVFAKNTVKNEFEYQMSVPKVNELLAFFHQKYPSKDCLIAKPSEFGYNLTVKEYNDRSLVLQLPKPEINRNCGNKLVGVKYTIKYKAINGNDGDLQCDVSTCKTVYSFSTVHKIVDLKPFTKYVFHLEVNTYYGEKLNESTQIGSMIVRSTTAGFPTAPRNVSIETISPTEAILQWKRPLEINSDTIWYEIHWETQNVTTGLKNSQQQTIENTTVAQLDFNLTQLASNQQYSVLVRAYSSNKTFNTSEELHIETMPEPEDITLLDKSPYSLKVKWKSPKNTTRYVLQYNVIGANDYVIVANSSSRDEAEEFFNITNLSPKTQYEFSVKLFYIRRPSAYIWPRNPRFVFETLGDSPSPPGRPNIEPVYGEFYKVKWEPSKDNGAPILEYCLESFISNLKRNVRSADGYSESEVTIKKLEAENHTLNPVDVPLFIEEQEVQREIWTVLYNGTDNYWISAISPQIESYSFRVRARNAYGWGKYSEISVPIGKPVQPQQMNSLLIATTVPVTVVVLIILVGWILYYRRRRKLEKKVLLPETHMNVELSTLRELPRGSNFIHRDNTLYSGGPLTDADVMLLPQIQRGRITMTSFLGSGAFGEVYEGCVTHDSAPDITRVAIKTLRKGATDQEKAEFLQEAQLMSNFKHEHILSLIGVCFDNDSLYIIMELMQGGDLLSYLRQSRPSVGTPSSLTLLDLVSMCVDVAAGCRYLEEMHFVHRDLACRNCLVSSVDRPDRVVKIGDFGLARDIYKNDYYRKEGEGLLPVRWMSPEGLVDGVYTSQSDIWAFGVLCWEIMTLGQQPYPARNNVEVLHYVRNGGRLTRPSDCPEELYQLMLKCWSYMPEDRPTFRYCLKVLVALKSNTNDAIPITSEGRVSNGGIFNRSYLLPDVNHNNHSAASFKYSGGSNPDCIEPTILVTPASSIASATMPKYLDLFDAVQHEDAEREEAAAAAAAAEAAADNFHNGPISLISDGYEIPIHNIDGSSSGIKERTFSSSSTVSDLSQRPVQHNHPQILTVALPNTREDCSSSRETLLLSQKPSDLPNLALNGKPIYTNTNSGEDGASTKTFA